MSQNATMQVFGYVNAQASQGSQIAAQAINDTRSPNIAQQYLDMNSETPGIFVPKVKIGNLIYTYHPDVAAYVLGDDDGGGGVGPSGGLIIQSDIDVATPQNYPAATAGQAFRIINSNPALITGLIGGAAGMQVERFDIILALNDNAGGTQAAVGDDWTIWEGELQQLWINGDSSVQGAILQNNPTLPNTSLSPFTVVTGSDNDILGATSVNSILSGSGNSITNFSEEAFVSGLNNTISGATAAVISGIGNTITGGFASFISGQSHTVINQGANSLIVGLSNTLATSDQVIVGGQGNNLLSATNSIVGGQTNTLGSLTNTALRGILTGTSNQVLGNPIASPILNFSVSGTLARADQSNKRVIASGSIDAAGDGQGEDFAATVRTAVLANLMTYFIPDNASIYIDAIICYTRDVAGLGAVGDSDRANITVLVKNVAGALTIVNTTQMILAGEIAGATIAAAIDNPTKSLRINVTPAVGDTLNFTIYSRAARSGFGAYA